MPGIGVRNGGEFLTVSDTPDRITGDYTPEAILPDHAVAWCAWMREQIKRVEDGQAVHEVCGDMILPVTFAARRI